MIKLYGTIAIILAGTLALAIPVIVAPPVSAQNPSGGVRLTPLADLSVGGAATQIVPADANRVALYCTNNDAAVHVRVGDGTVTATKGMRLPATRTITVTSSGIISGFSEGAAVTLSCASETR